MPYKDSHGKQQFRWQEGNLVQAIKNNRIVLLDELNLAPPELLLGISAILTATSGVMEIGRE